jgi:nitroimidazol reductase NimA-like FMN-containing flavoprotein (pyridoxamine 5'-phosphate oxidase superfamily)
LSDRGKEAFGRRPETQLHEQPSPGAAAMPWDAAAAVLGEAEIYWVTTVRPDGRPHVTPLVAVWLDDALYFCTGDDERKARNLRENRSCVMTTGCNVFRSGIDVVVEGEATNVTDVATLQRVADALLTKYDWPYRARRRARKRSGDRMKARTAVSRSCSGSHRRRSSPTGAENPSARPAIVSSGAELRHLVGEQILRGARGSSYVTGRTRRWATAKEQSATMSPASPMPIIQNSRTATDRTRTPLVSGRGDRVMCVAKGDWSRAACSRFNLCSKPSNRRFPPPRMTGAIEIDSSSACPALRA